MQLCVKRNKHLVFLLQLRFVTDLFPKTAESQVQDSSWLVDPAWFFSLCARVHWNPISAISISAPIATTMAKFQKLAQACQWLYWVLIDIFRPAHCQRCFKPNQLSILKVFLVFHLLRISHALHRFHVLQTSQVDLWQHIGIFIKDQSTVLICAL